MKYYLMYQENLINTERSDRTKFTFKVMGFDNYLLKGISLNQVIEQNPEYYVNGVEL